MRLCKSLKTERCVRRAGNLVLNLSTVVSGTSIGDGHWVTLIHEVAIDLCLKDEEALASWHQSWGLPDVSVLAQVTTLSGPEQPIVKRYRRRTQ